jgi:hypothetical protein
MAENPLWHRSIAVEQMLYRKRRFVMTGDIKLSPKEGLEILQLLAAMRGELPPGRD